MNEIMDIIRAKGRKVHLENVKYTTAKRMCKIHEYSKEHLKLTEKEPTKHELICFCIETERMVIKYLNIKRECNAAIKAFYNDA